MRNPFSLIPRFDFDFTTKDFFNCLKYILGNSKEIDLGPLKSIFGERNFFFTNYGRTSLYLILKALGLPKKSKIGVPLYSCPVVFDAIVRAGHDPVFVDIDLDNYTIDPGDLDRKVKDLDAVIVIHTFGRPADMDEIMKIAGGIPVIEDCAHSFLSRYKGELTGLIGDASFFSLSKYVSGGRGGMAIFNNDELGERVQTVAKELNKPSLFSEFKHVFLNYSRSVVYTKYWFGMMLPIGSSLEKNIDLTSKKNFFLAEIAKSDLHLLMRKLSYFKGKVERQRKNSFIMLEDLENTQIKLPIEKKDTYCNYYLFPIMLGNKQQRDTLSYFLRENGIDSAKLYSQVPAKARVYGYNGDCPNTEILADTVLTVPNHYFLSESEIRRIGRNIAFFLENFGK